MSVKANPAVVGGFVIGAIILVLVLPLRKEKTKYNEAIKIYNDILTENPHDIAPFPPNPIVHPYFRGLHLKFDDKLPLLLGNPLLRHILGLSQI